jgi:hypothetical protein
MDMFERQFEEQKRREAPLATRMRPGALHEFVARAVCQWLKESGC